MEVDEETIRNRSTEAVFERGRNYRDEGRIQRLDRFGDLVTATVRGSNRYDVTVEGGGRSLDTRCTCPYDGGDDCKHVVAVLLELVENQPEDECERVESVLDDVSADDLRDFVYDALAENAELREAFLARFGDDHKSVEEYREGIAPLFEKHADPVVYEAIDFSRFFGIAEEYRDRDRYLTAATVYRAVFEEVDEQSNWIDGAYDHYARILQKALDGYVDCILATDPNPDEFDTFASVLEARTSTDPLINNDQFLWALDDLEERYDRSDY
ncbi:putative Zn finger protein [Halarchaeum solikamskense]|uniref:SWIM zinc finger family protein n=1 Tax=Halarchaeum nitratireducens TaxID=489913 RepID=UPI001B3AC9DB|nr:SWIM zinc finger family protein [Halarchaeum solikamskense]MBP2252686.1 putative Zn finger protein [Halarchaeum solikamskense]